VGGGPSRQLSDDDEDFVIATASTLPVKLGQSFTRWSLRKLVAYLRKVHGRVIRIGREALRCLHARRGVTFQCTKTWKESPDRERRRSWTVSSTSHTEFSWSERRRRHPGEPNSFSAAHTERLSLQRAVRVRGCDASGEPGSLRPPHRAACSPVLVVVVAWASDGFLHEAWLEKP
jgi:hypothetical protein